MGGIEGNIKEIGLIFRNAFDKGTSFLAYQIGGIAILNKWTVVAMPVGLTITYVSEIIDRPIVMANELRESTTGWQPLLSPMPQMPFAEYPSMLVARLGKNIGHSLFARVQSIISLRRDYRSHESIANGIAAGHKACPRWSTNGT